MIKHLHLVLAKLPGDKILSEIKQPIAIEDIAEISKNSLAVSTIYRVIADLLDSKIVKTFNSPDQKLLVELSLDESNHHHHLFCESCNIMLDIDFQSDLEKMIDNVISKIEDNFQINITGHSFEIYGDCKKPGQHKNI